MKEANILHTLIDQRKNAMPIPRNLLTSKSRRTKTAVGSRPAMKTITTPEEVQEEQRLSKIREIHRVLSSVSKIDL